MAPQRKEFCKRGHRIGDNPYIFPDGKRTCRQCRTIWRKELNAKIYAINKEKRRAKEQERIANLPPSLVLYGVSRRKIAAQRTWAVRRERYGPKGMASEKLEKMRELSRYNVRFAHANPPKKRTHCRMGHELNEKNARICTYKDAKTQRWYQRKVCRVCERIRTGHRPAWIEKDGVRVSLLAHDRCYRLTLKALKRAMIRAHPDKGGTSEKFWAAKRAIERFKKKEEKWYKQWGIPCPVKRKKQGEDQCEKSA